jgi:Spy/CpxP family protein refolding chaperone
MRCLAWSGRLTLGVFLLAGAVHAQVSLGPRVGPGVAEVRLVERNSEKLGLDEKTLAAVKKLATETTKREEKLNTALRNARLAMRDLLDSPLPAEKDLMAGSDAITKATSEIQRDELKTTLALRALLTGEQRTQLIELRKEPPPPRRRRPRR